MSLKRSEAIFNEICLYKATSDDTVEYTLHWHLKDPNLFMLF